MEAIARWQSVLTAHSQADPLNRALTLSYLSLAHQQLGNWTAATRTITQSLNLLQQQPRNTDTRIILGQALNTQGSLQFAQGQTEQALTTWQQATAAYEAAGDHQRRLGSLINQAQAQQALGLFLRARQTLAQVEQSLQQQPDSELKATGLRSLGNVLLLLGDLPNARRVLQQSLSLLERLPLQGTEQTLSQALSAVLISLGNTAHSQKEMDGAIAFYQRAAQVGVPITRAQARINQFSVLLELKRLSEAKALLPVVLSQVESLPANRAAVFAQINLARNLAKLAKATDATLFQQAAQVLAVAVQQAQSLGDRRAEAYALGNLGNLYEQTQQPQEAQQLTEQALMMAQAISAPDIAYQWQWQLGRVLKAQGKLADATSAYTAAFQTLQAIRSDLVAANPDLQFSFRESVEPVYRELVELLLRREPDQEVSQGQLKQARQVIESLQVAELDNFFRTACLNDQTVAIDQIDQTASAVIYPIILADRLEVILSLPQQPLRQYTVSVPRETVEKTLDELRSQLEQPFLAPEGQQLGQQVYDWLIRPLLADVQQVKTLVFVLDGALRNVPVAALYDGNQYLIEQFTVALAPGLQLVNPRALTQTRLEALVGGLTEARDGFAALPNVAREVEEIKAEVPSRVLLNQSFTSSTLEQQIDALPFSVVHLATHGQFSSNAEETFVLAWDKRITVNELAALLRTAEGDTGEAIELLVLSACETAAGDARAALGLAGVAVRAGARSTLASLWSLDDESGARLIGEFYRELVKGNLSKAEALRRAQLTLLRNPSYRTPRYWAPYVLVGNWL